MFDSGLNKYTTVTGNYDYKTIYCYITTRFLYRMICKIVTNRKTNTVLPTVRNTNNHSRVQTDNRLCIHMGNILPKNCTNVVTTWHSPKRHNRYFYFFKLNCE